MTIKNIRSIMTLSIALLMSSFSLAQAQESPDWTYIEAGYSFNKLNKPYTLHYKGKKMSSYEGFDEIDSVTVDGTYKGLDLNGSIEVSDNIFVLAGINRAKNKTTEGKIKAFNLGGGFKMNVLGFADLYVSAQYLRAKDTVWDLNSTGYELSTGARASIGAFQMDGKVSYTKSSIKYVGDVKGIDNIAGLINDIDDDILDLIDDDNMLNALDDFRLKSKYFSVSGDVTYKINDMLGFGVFSTLNTEGVMAVGMKIRTSF